MTTSQIQKLKSVVLSVLFFALGFSFFFSVIHYLPTQRDPAAVHGRMNTISGLDHEQLKSELQKKIKITTVNNGAEKAILLEGFSSHLCKLYPKIQLVFLAEGVLVGGEPTQMKVTAPCESAQDPAEMASIRIPIEKIMNSKPKDAEFSFLGYSSTFTFSKSADEWPHVWILSSFEFLSLNGTSKLVKLQDELHPAPVVLEF